MFISWGEDADESTVSGTLLSELAPDGLQVQIKGGPLIRQAWTGQAPPDRIYSVMYYIVLYRRLQALAIQVQYYVCTVRLPPVFQSSVLDKV